MKRTSLTIKAVLSLWTLVLMLMSTLAPAADYVTYLHVDVQGSPLVATDEQGNVVWQEDYEPWGARQVKDTASATSSRGSKVWYTGKEEEANLGLYYYGARWYLPETGQFAAVDPAGVTLENPRSFNRYAYANNNPVIYKDPDGKMGVLVAALAIGLITFTDFANAPGPNDQIYTANGLEPFMNAFPGPRLIKSVGGGVLKAVSKKGDGEGGSATTSSKPVITKETIKRKSSGRDGAESEQIIERQDGEMISRTHRVTKDGEVVHQHQNHVGKHGGERQFPDQWTGTTTKSAPYENYPPSAGPDKVPGGRTF